MSIWIGKHENSFLREVVVPSSQEVLRADETERHQIFRGSSIVVFTGFRRGMGCLNSRCLLPTTLALPERQASPLTGCCGASVGRQGQGETVPLQVPLQRLPYPWHDVVLQCMSQKWPEGACAFGSITLASSTVSLSISADNKQRVGPAFCILVTMKW